MKLHIMFFLLVFIAASCKHSPSQTKNVRVHASHPPHYPGGLTAWHNHLRSIIYRPKVDGRVYTGTVFLNFMVKTDSTVSDIKVVRGIHPTYDSLAVSILASSEPWIPGTEKGQPVDARQAIRIVFPRLK
ncbi:energy transducer TonB [Roseivirga pacifica]|uniref:energy transducer TonB n=1 Tax=Roseivirga pacifica TaxID=1267423 RepID=UPI00227AF959